MSKDETGYGDATVHLPPKFNLRGRRQLWFVEGVPHEDLVNGLLSSLVIVTPLALLVGGLL